MGGWGPGKVPGGRKWSLVAEERTSADEVTERVNLIMSKVL